MDSGKGVEILANYHLTAQEAAQQVRDFYESVGIKREISEHSFCVLFKFTISWLEKDKDSICLGNI